MLKILLAISALTLTPLYVHASVHETFAMSDEDNLDYLKGSVKKLQDLFAALNNTHDTHDIILNASIREAINSKRVRENKSELNTPQPIWDDIVALLLSHDVERKHAKLLTPAISKILTKHGYDKRRFVLAMTIAMPRDELLSFIYATDWLNSIIMHKDSDCFIAVQVNGLWYVFAAAKIKKSKATDL